MTLNTQAVAYIYRAEILCPNCTIEALKSEGKALPHDDSSEDTIRTIAERVGIDYDEPWTYDSDTLPKPVLRYQIECGIDANGEDDPDCHERCDACATSLCGDV